MEKLSSSNPVPGVCELRQRIGIIKENIHTAALAGGFDPAAVRLMAVTKTVPAGTINAAIEAGIDLIGENREQSLSGKYDEIRRDGVEIHFIGHLQRNKAARVVKMVDCVQSLDAIALAKELDKQAAAIGKQLQVLVEVNIGQDPNKSGVHPDAAREFVDALRELPSLSVRGLMTILPLECTTLQMEKYFSQIHALYVDIRAQNRDNVCMDCLSMGMSGDYKLAVKHGATMVRLGTVLFR